MKYLSRVVWSEGMYLGPHHFQAQSRYFEDSIGFTTAALWFEPWGLVGAQLDAEALKNGTVSLIHARGIFDDGMVFHMPECDPLPEARNIADLFPAVRDTVTIMLAVAPRRPEGANTMTPGDAATLSQAASGQNGALRFRAEIQMLHDEPRGATKSPCISGARTSSCCWIPKRPATWSRCRSRGLCGTARDILFSTKASFRRRSRSAPASG